MGLDTTHDCWHGAYSAFGRWRQEIAGAAGYGELGAYYGYGGQRDWPEGDALVELLDHSDCDGELPVSVLLPLAARLEEIKPALADDWAVDRAEQFIAGLRLAAERGEPVEFQ